MSFSEFLLFNLNKLFPKPKLEGRESDEAYAEMEYRHGSLELKKFNGRVDLKNKVILDMGCGLGGKTVYYAEQAARAVGVDSDKKYISVAKEFANKRKCRNVRFVRADGKKLPFKAESFGAIIMNDVMEHLADPKGTLHECIRVVKKGRRIYINFPPWTSPHAGHVSDYIYVPWCQLLFSDETIINVLKRIKATRMVGEISYIEHFRRLNKMRIEDFKKLLQKMGLKVMYLDIYMIKNISFLKYLPILNKYLISNIICIIEK